MTIELFSYANEQEVIAAALSIMEARSKYGTTFNSSETAKHYFRLRLGDLEREVFSVLFLSSQNALIATEDLFFGTIDGTTVHPREVARCALKYNAASVIFAHNHPSGVAEPSEADKAITKQLVDALSLLEIRVIDHIVVTTRKEVSFAERGML